ncbi:otolin-1-like [Stegostoma tigrinum]|uniref:otolin-1-like n=1 Tax=Stegostoma tigrinum TaxID=3053191 RepID=UPI00202B6C30|nr:otolin-1-like [Stegostoma tigrinum]XP_048397545.1 otolin-1-like [Stegostoma tigrinum]XP_048397546.1 otolin-1-like [Stegostoma tigrinum]XP_048397547.1 otolin-1-like [Stegostoma tigrinum]XP_059506868.1 otolin-1-like [Stegostoma tigrinum]
MVHLSGEIEMLHTFLIVLAVLTSRIYAQNGTSLVGSDSGGIFLPREQGDFGSHETESPDPTASSEIKTTLSDLVAMTDSGFQEDETNVLMTISDPQVTHLPTNENNDAEITAYMDSDINGLSGIKENNILEVPIQGFKENNTLNKSSEIGALSPKNNPGKCCLLGAKGEKLHQGAEREFGSSQNSSSGETEYFKRNHEEENNIELADSSKEIHSQEEERRKVFRREIEPSTFSDPEGSQASQGSSSTEGIIGTDQQEVTKLLSSNDEKNGCATAQAFSVGLMGQIELPLIGTPVKFQNIFFNDQQLYNASSGKFIAEVGGIYSFTYNVIVSEWKLTIGFFMNDVNILNTSSVQVNGNIGSASASLILNLSNGDEIWLGLVNSGGGKQMTHRSMSTFSGFLLAI